MKKRKYRWKEREVGGRKQEKERQEREGDREEQKKVRKDRVPGKREGEKGCGRECYTNFNAWSKLCGGRREVKRGWGD